MSRWGRYGVGLVLVCAAYLAVVGLGRIPGVAQAADLSSQGRGVLESISSGQLSGVSDLLDEGGTHVKEGFGAPKGAPSQLPAAKERETGPKVGGRIEAGDVLLINEVRYRVDREGRLWIPGEEPFFVLGWTLPEVRAALSTLDFGKGKDLSLRLMPRSGRLTGLGVLPFGYDILRGDGRTITPDPRAPVSKDYVIGPGDTILIQLFGKEHGEYELGVTRDGTLLIPKFGPVQVAGLPYDEVRNLITTRIQQQALGVEVGVTMGALRSIEVFVLGDVELPGLHTISALSTPIHALYAARGVRENGSLRKVEVKRDGKLISRLDLYDFLLKGDSSGQQRLDSGDVVFVPPLSGVVAVSGMVRRPAIYELLGGETVADIIALAGGISATGNRAAIRLQRLDPVEGQQVRDLSETELDTELRDGDILRVFPKLSGTENTVFLGGHVAVPGEYPWHEGMRLVNLLPTADRLLKGADIEFVLITREREDQRIPEYLQTNLSAAMADPGSPDNVALLEGDQVTVFSMEEDRVAILRPEVERLEHLAVAGRVPAETITIGGEVHHEGRFPMTRGMRLLNALAAAGDATQRAFPHQALITRFTLAPDGARRETEHITVDLAAAREGNLKENPELRPGDHIMIHRVPEWQGETVRVSGEVRFPGEYVIERGDTLSDLIERAGGLTDFSFPEGAVFTRLEIRHKAEQEWQRLIRELEEQLVQLTVEPASFGKETGRAESLAAGRQLLGMMKQTEMTGRIAIQLTRDKSGRAVIEGTEPQLRNGDEIIIPRRPDSVLVLGEVYRPTAHLFQRKQNVRDFVKRSGGITDRGNPKNVILVRANGSVESVRVGRFHSGGRVQLGDTIVIPKKIETFSMLKLATDVSQVLYQVAISAASAKAVGAF